MNDNPYAAPRSALVAEGDDVGPMFTALQALVASLLGGFLASVLMIHRNLHALHRPAMARGALGMGLVFQVLVVLWSALAPHALPWLIISILPAALGALLVQQVTLSDPRIAARGAYRTRPNGLVAAITGLSFVATVVLVVVVELGLMKLGFTGH